MKRSIFCMVLCVTFLGIGNSAAYSQRSQPAKEEGTFRMFIGGKEAGFNSYKIIPGETGIEVISKSEVRSFVKMRFFEHARLDREYQLLSYHLTIVLPFGAQEVVAKCHGDSIRIAYRRSLAASFKHVTLPGKRPLFLLDNNMLDHWDILLRAISPKISSVLHAVVLVPQVLKLLPVELKEVGKDTVHSGNSILQTRKIQIQFSKLEAIASVNEQSGELEKLAIPQQAFVMWRMPKLIPFSPAEEDSLLQKIRAKKAIPSPKAYPSREVTFWSDSVRLAGTLTVPKSRFRQKFPAVLFLAGSGALDRNENAPAFHSNFFPQLADTLTPSGLVTLRYDKRGTGESSGSFSQADVKDFLADARAALRFLKQQPEVDSTRVAVLGHSEGAVLGLMLASSGVHLNGLVLMAGPARNMEEVVLSQVRYLLTLQGKSSAEVKQKLKEEKAFFRKIREGKLSGVTPQGNASWWREHLQFNPIEAVRKIACPLFIMNGEKDYQISATKDAQVLFQTARKTGKDVTLKIYPNLDHLFEPVQGRSTPQKYLKPGRKIPREVKADLVQWLKEKLP